jgi:arylsulfatase A-like enzyme
VQGFDEFTGYNHQGEAHFYYTDTIDKIVDGNTVRFPIDSTKYTHEIFAEDALNFIKKYKDTTFFLYLPFCIPHAELLVPQKDLEQYLDEDGNSIFEETPHPGGHYRKQDKPRAAYAAMVSKLDRDVGRVLDLLKEHGLDENTYVFFTSDNGPHTAGGHDFRYFDGNGPLRGFKRDLYEGGIRVPMIAWAPGKVPQGNVSDVVWAFWDVVPTFSDMIGAKPPRENDGMSFKQTIHGELQNQLHAYLYWEHCVGWSKEPKKLSQAIRAGEWKLLKIKKPGQETSYELYNLYNDFSEENNLFNQEKEKAGELLKLIDEVCEKPQSDAFYDFTRFE